MIELFVRPGPALTREQFVASHPPFSVALDGYVQGEPFLDIVEAGPYRNFNHHEGVDRTCMTATCEQARRAVLLGLYDLFQVEGERTASLFVNDCDQDVCLATWLLLNPDRVAEPLVRALCQIEDLLDTSAGTFPMPHDRELLGQVRWVFEPYARVRPQLAGLSGKQMREVIRDVHHRIEQFVLGKAEEAPLEGTYKRLGGGDGWLMVEVTGQGARLRMTTAGVRAAIEVVGRSGDRFHYALWRRSEYVVGFPLPDILQALNVAEGLPPVAPTGWGGAATVGGSPRGRGSALPPEDVERIVAEVVSGRAVAWRRAS